MRRLFPHALLAATLLLAVSAPAATAAPTWLTPQTLSDEGVNPSQAHVVVATDGTIDVIWAQSDGSNMRVMATTLTAPEASWTAPEYISPAGEDIVNTGQPEDIRLVADGGGTSTALWRTGGAVKSATRLQGGTAWTPAATLTAGGENATSSDLAAGPDGTVVAAWTSNNDGHRARARVRAAGAADWGAVTVISNELSADLYSVALGFAPDGDGMAVWSALGGSPRLSGARFDAGDHSWTPTTDIAAAGNSIERPNVALNDAGRAVAIWAEPGASDQVAVAATLPAGSTTWDDPEQLTATGHTALFFGSSVASDGNGDFVIAYQDALTSDPYTTSRPVTRTLDAGSSGWGPQDQLGEGGGVPLLRRAANGDLIVLFVGSDDGMTMQLRSAHRPSGGSAFTLRTVSAFGTDFGHGTQSAAGDDAGNLYAVWPQNAGGENSIRFAVGDGAGPVLGSLSGPATATVGEAVAFSVADPFDLWSGITSTSWAFGDGATATGAGVTHSYDAPGRYTVTVTATDTLGNVTQSSRDITVASVAGPGDDTADESPKPPVVIAPVIEARLAGKTVTVNARVTLKAGQKCKGTITVTTAFGGKTYKVPAKLAVKNGACRATTQITLKKTPSLRTKLRVTVGATKADKKKLTPRTITSRRG